MTVIICPTCEGRGDLANSGANYSNRNLPVCSTCEGYGELAHDEPHFTTIFEAETSEGRFALSQWSVDGSYNLDIEGVEPIGLAADVIAALDTIIREVKR